MGGYAAGVEQGCQLVARPVEPGGEPVEQHGVVGVGHGERRPEPSAGRPSQRVGRVVAGPRAPVEATAAPCRLEGAHDDRQRLDGERPEPTGTPRDQREGGDDDEQEGRAQPGREQGRQADAVVGDEVGEVGDVPDQSGLLPEQPEHRGRVVPAQHLVVAHRLAEAEQGQPRPGPGEQLSLLDPEASAAGEGEGAVDLDLEPGEHGVVAVGRDRSRRPGRRGQRGDAQGLGGARARFHHDERGVADVGEQPVDGAAAEQRGRGHDDGGAVADRGGLERRGVADHVDLDTSVAQHLGRRTRPTRARVVGVVGRGRGRSARGERGHAERGEHGEGEQQRGAVALPGAPHRTPARRPASASSSASAPSAHSRPPGRSP